MILFLRHLPDSVGGYRPFGRVFSPELRAPRKRRPSRFKSYHPSARLVKHQLAAPNHFYPNSNYFFFAFLGFFTSFLYALFPFPIDFAKNVAQSL